MEKENGAKQHPEQNSGIIFRSYITTKDGERIYAKQYGIRAFAIRVSDSEKNAS